MTYINIQIKDGRSGHINKTLLSLLVTKSPLNKFKTTQNLQFKCILVAN